MRNTKLCFQFQTRSLSTRYWHPTTRYLRDHQSYSMRLFWMKGTGERNINVIYLGDYEIISGSESFTRWLVARVLGQVHVSQLHFNRSAGRTEKTFFFLFFFKFFCWTKAQFVEPLIAPVLDFVCPSSRVSNPEWISRLHSFLLACCDPEGHVWCDTCLFHQ